MSDGFMTGRLRRILLKGTSRRNVGVGPFFTNILREFGLHIIKGLGLFTTNELYRTCCALEILRISFRGRVLTHLHFESDGIGVDALCGRKLYFVWPFS
jgi:hypothetical protein